MMQDCEFRGCSLKATLIGFKGGMRGYCSWHDYVLEDVKVNNTRMMFEKWRDEIANHKDDYTCSHKNSYSCNSHCQSDRQAFLNHFTWSRVNNF